ncbi:MAG: hypothetical protein MZV63_64940 [Marinilabiliales bacterium]|nr:hypothetical protein [Marinilabiliales bacterium]
MKTETKEAVLIRKIPAALAAVAVLLASAFPPPRAPTAPSRAGSSTTRARPYREPTST